MLASIDFTLESVINRCNDELIVLRELFSPYGTTLSHTSLIFLGRAKGLLTQEDYQRLQDYLKFYQIELSFI